MAVVMTFGFVVAWSLQALALSRAMRRRGFDGAAWLLTSSILGPAAWALAIVEVRRSAAGPEIVRWGVPGPGPIDVLVVLEADVLPHETGVQLRRVLPYAGRVVLARAVRAGAPGYAVKEARRFLAVAATRLRLDGAELQLRYGTVDMVVGETRRRREFGIVLRSDQPAELFDGDGSRQEMRCLRDAPAA